MAVDTPRRDIQVAFFILEHRGAGLTQRERVAHYRNRGDGRAGLELLDFLAADGCAACDREAKEEGNEGAHGEAPMEVGPGMLESLP